MFKKIALFSFFALFSFNIKSGDNVLLGFVSQGIRVAKEDIIPSVSPIVKYVVVPGVALSAIGLAYEGSKTGIVTSLFWLTGQHKRICAQQKEIVKAQIEEKKRQILYQKCTMMKKNGEINNLSAWILNENPEYAGMVQAMTGDLEKFVDLLEKQQAS